MASDGQGTVTVPADELIELLRKSGMQVGEVELALGDPRFNEDGDLELSFAWSGHGVHPTTWGSPPDFIGREARIREILKELRPYQKEIAEELERELRAAGML